MKKISVLIVLLVLCSSFVWADLKGDINGDDKVGLEEAVYALQATSGLAVQPVKDTCIPAVVPKTGQTISYAVGDDGDLEKGVAIPNPRFTDNLDGTVTDNLTELIWLKDASAPGSKTWAAAITYCNGLADGAAGLTDESVAGDWRLPNTKELQSLIDFSQYAPALPSDHLFTNVHIGWYWSGTTCAFNVDNAWSVGIDSCGMSLGVKTQTTYVWPVRGGND